MRLEREAVIPPRRYSSYPTMQLPDCRAVRLTPWPQQRPSGAGFEENANKLSIVILYGDMERRIPGGIFRIQIGGGGD